MFVRIDVVTPPEEEPVTLAEVKRNLKVDASNPSLYLTDADIERKLTAAVERCEKFTRRALITQTLDVWFDQTDGLGYFALPRGHVQSITSITSYDPFNEATIAAVDTYNLIGSDVILQDWLPYHRDRMGVVIRIVAGYGDAEDVPAPLKEGIIEYATYLCDNPGGEGPEIRYQAQVTGSGLPAGVIDKWKPFQIPMV
jgi:uncharacterized phiE125 gp8 family phage protein